MLRRRFRLARVAAVGVAVVTLMAAVAANRDDAVEAQRLATVLMTIKADGTERQVRTAQTTVGAALKEAGVEVGPRDEVTPAPGEHLTGSANVRVVRVKEITETVSEAIAFDTVKTFTRSLRPGQVKLTRTGELGEKQVRYFARYEDGRLVKRTKIGAEIVKKPVNQVASIGFKGHYSSRGEYRTALVMRMHATAYDPGPRSCGKYATGRTGCGLRAGYGVVAVDPRVIRLGTRLYVEGYGYAIAGDTGRAIKGNKIDLGFNTYREAISFGRRNVTVHVLQR